MEWVHRHCVAPFQWNGGMHKVFNTTMYYWIGIPRDSKPVLYCLLKKEIIYDFVCTWSFQFMNLMPSCGPYTYPYSFTLIFCHCHNSFIWFTKAVYEAKKRFELGENWGKKTPSTSYICTPIRQSLLEQIGFEPISTNRKIQVNKTAKETCRF